MASILIGAQRADLSIMLDESGRLLPWIRVFLRWLDDRPGQKALASAIRGKEADLAIELGFNEQLAAWRAS
jgi:hypothetical protein